jgi:hypothetical protein
MRLQKCVERFAKHDKTLKQMKALGLNDAFTDPVRRAKTKALRCAVDEAAKFNMTFDELGDMIRSVST